MIANKRFKRFWVILLGLLLLGPGARPCPAQAPVQVLILPFKIHSETDLTFLQEGVYDMLSTRLARQGKVIPIPKERVQSALSQMGEPLNPKTALDLGQSLDADYVLFGSLTVFGESISSDAKFYKVSSGELLQSLSKSGSEKGELISHVNAFAREINQEVFGITEKPVQAEAPEPKPKPQPPKRDESRKHPEQIWQEERGTDESVSKGGKTGKGLIVRTEEQAPESDEGLIVRTQEQSPEAQAGMGASAGLWKSRNFKMRINGLSVGDMDGDGRNEIAFIGEQTLMVYRYVADRFVKIGEQNGHEYDSYLHLDSGDFNQNGKAELFVTSANRRHHALNSFVLEWREKAFSPVVENQNWYYRVIHLPDQDPILLGQERGMGDKVFVGGVQELTWGVGEYIPGNSLFLPDRLDIYDFIHGRLSKGGRDRVVAFAPNEHLRVLSREGQEQWRSSDPYGGSSTYVEYPAEASASIGDYQESKRHYLPQRLLLADTDQNGQNEIIVAKNKDTTGRLFSKLRIYKSGHIESLVWEDLGLYSQWKTRRIPGHVSDYVLGDADNDGQTELVFSVVTGIDSVISQAKSFIVFQDLETQANP